MHLGNARTALLAWVQARASGSDFWLRFEDLDTGRVREWAYDLTRRDLEWLGLDWDAEFVQSRRLDLYAEALTRLPGYPCTCTRRDLREAAEASAGAPHGAEAPYPGFCRARPQRPGQPAAWRWRAPPGLSGVRDHLSGETLCQNLERDVGDFVLRRSDGTYAYHLAVVVDDALTGVTDVVRGADLWPSAPRQAALFRALGYPPPEPRYWHLPLMTDFAGERLAKRGGAPPVRDWREGGANPARLRAELIRSLGWPAFAEVGEEVSVDELRRLCAGFPGGLPPLPGAAPQSP